MPCTGPKREAARASAEAKWTSDETRPSDSPCPGRSSATARQPAATRGSTRGVICPAWPPQPWTRSTAGPSPQARPTTRPPRAAISKRSPRASTARSSSRTRARSGVKKSLRATRAAAPGASVLATRIPVRSQGGAGTGRRRPIVLFWGSVRALIDCMEGLLGFPGEKRRSGTAAVEEGGEGGARPFLGARVVEQLGGLLEDHADADELVGELVEVELGPEVPLLDGGAGGARDDVVPVALGAHQDVADRPGAVVVLMGEGHEEAASAAAVAVDPGEMEIEQAAHPRLAARLAERRRHHVLDEMVDGPLHHLDLQRLLRPEMGEQPA